MTTTPADELRAADEPGDQIHEWFSLSYSNYLVLHRSLMQSMPAGWQQRMVEDLNELRAAYAHIEQPEGFKVEAAISRDISELTEAEQAAHGVVEDWYRGETPPDGLSEEDLAEWRAEHEDPDGAQYFRDGSEVSGDDQVLIPVPDPVPHYQRGRTYIAPAALAVARQVLSTVTAQPMTDTTPTLRDRIAEAAMRLGHPQWDAAALADAVLAVLPAGAPAETCGSLSQPTYSGEIMRCVLPLGHPRQCQSTTEYPWVSWPSPTAEADLLVTAGHRLALSEALGLGTGAPWDAIRDRAAALRRLADEAQQPTDGRDLTARWDKATGKPTPLCRCGFVPIACDADRVPCAPPEHPAPAVTEEPTDGAAGAPFGSLDCTCIPWTRQGGAPRLLGPGDTVDQIGGWERALDCPHHKPAGYVAYLAARDAQRAAAVTAVLGELTPRERHLVHDAAVMGYVRGRMHPKDEPQPKDSAVVAEVIDACLALPDLYPGTNAVWEIATADRTNRPAP